MYNNRKMTELGGLTDENNHVFGDSLTWGYDAVSTRRFPPDVRFTGLISQRFPECRVIEEGLKGRTNALDDAIEPGRNGHQALPMLLCTHDPIDIFCDHAGNQRCETEIPKLCD